MIAVPRSEPWQLVPVREAGEVRLGRQRSPLHQSGRFTTPYLRVANVFDGWIDYTDVLSMDFTPSERRVYGLRSGDILLNEGQSLELVGRSAVYEGEPGAYCFQNTLIRFRCNETSVPGYCRAVFNFWLETGRFAQVARQTTSVAHLGADRFAEMRFPRPNIEEQRRIADILDAADAGIWQTEAVIAKLRQMKAGLLHDLLTRGLDEQGRLRDPVAHPEQFKDTPLGRLPVPWKFVPVMDTAQESPGSTTIGPFGSQLLAADYRPSGVPIVFVRDVRPDGFEWNSNVYIEQKKARELSAHDVSPGDVLATKMGLPPCVACIYPMWMPPGVITADIIRLRPNQLLAGSTWLATYLNSPAVARQVAAITAGVTRPKVTLHDFRRLLVAVPTLGEEQRISSFLGDMDGRVQGEETYRDKLKLQKRGLMHDLLTGRVRV